MRLRGWRRERDAELREEIEAHLRMAIAERVARGASLRDAEREVRREFGNDLLVREVTRDVWGGAWLEQLLRDVRAGVRGLRRSPGFATVAVLSLALGVGANTAVFTVVNGVLLRPLPFTDPDRLVLLSHLPERLPFDVPPSMFEDAYQDLRQGHRAFDGLASFGRAQLTLTGAGDPVRIPAALVTADFMAVLGVAAAAGRAFLPGDDLPGNEPVVVLGDRVWRERFAGRAEVIGRSVRLDGVLHTVIGVMPASFTFPYDAQVWVPMVRQQGVQQVWLRPVVARLVRNVTREQAAREIERTLADFDPPPGQKMQVRVVPLEDFLVGRARRSLLVFSGAVAFVLLIACANVANMLLMRAAARDQEIAVRAALGASRGRLIRQLLTESTVLALVGGVAGILLSYAGVRWLLATAPAGRIPRIQDVRIDVFILTISLGATLLAGLLFGLAPALTATRQHLRSAVGGAARTLGGGTERLRRALAITEIAVAIVLLTGAGLLLRSFARIRAVDPGFDAQNVIAMRLYLPESAYPDATKLLAFHTALLERLEHIPGVTASGSVNWAPLGSSLIRGDFGIEGRPELTRGFTVDKLVASHGYFRALAIPVVFGRDFDVRDDARASPVAIISRSVARRFWPPDGGAAVGRRITGRPDAETNEWMTIAGVVEDVTSQTLTGDKPAAIYTPLAQTDRPVFLNDMTFLLRTERAAGDLMPVVRAAVRDLDPDLPIPLLATMNDIVAGSISEPRFQANLLSIFSVLALLLAAIGTYGVLAHDVSSRTREIGLRMALGADRFDIARMVLRRALLLAVPGIALGTAGALALTRVLASSLFEVEATDPFTFFTVAAALLVTALFAAVMPSRRATSVDPLTAVRLD